MTVRYKHLVTPCLALVFGLLASASTLAAKPAPAAHGALPKGAENLHAYMISSADLTNEDYMKCVRSKIKLPADKYVVENVSAAQDCHSEKD